MFCVVLWKYIARFWTGLAQEQTLRCSKKKETGNVSYLATSSLNNELRGNWDFSNQEKPNKRTPKHNKMLSHCTWWGETEIWHEDTLTWVVLGFSQRQG